MYIKKQKNVEGGETMSNKSKQIYRIEKYLEGCKIKNIVFISHTKMSAKYYYKELKEIINLEKYNISFMSGRTEEQDGLKPKETIGIMCGVWYKDKELRNKYNFWEFIDKIYTMPLTDIDKMSDIKNTFEEVIILQSEMRLPKETLEKEEEELSKKIGIKVVIINAGYKIANLE